MSVRILFSPPQVVSFIRITTETEVIERLEKVEWYQLEVVNDPIEQSAVSIDHPELNHVANQEQQQRHCKEWIHGCGDAPYRATCQGGIEEIL